MTTSTVTNIENMPLDKRMALQGYSVTDKRWGGWDNANRMVIDKDGKEVGFKTPSQCFTFIKKIESKN